jgi:hypothetical protein
MIGGQFPHENLCNDFGRLRTARGISYTLAGGWAQRSLETGAMGIAERYGIEVWRWHDGQWRAKHHDGTKEFRKPSELGGISGQKNGDWLIERRRAGRGTYIPAEDMFETGTVWHFDGMEWHSIYRRSHGLDRPQYLDELHDAAEKGDVLVESGAADELTVYDEQGVRYALAPEIAAVIDHKADEVPDGSHLADVPTEEKVEAAAQAIAHGADKVISKLDNLRRISAEWARYKPGDPVTRQMGLVLLKALEEANPGPTPGTTAINDYVSLTNDILSGKIDAGFHAQGIDSKGSAAADAVGNIAYCKLVSDALAGCGAVLDGVQQLRGMLKAENLAPGTKTGDRQLKGELKTALASYELDAVKGVGYLFTATDKVIHLVDASSTAAQATGAVATMAVAPATTVVGMLTFARHVRKAHRARLRWSAYKKMLKEQDFCAYHEKLQACLHYLVGKSGRRVRTQAATATAAVISSAGGTILTVTAIVGGANAWNPVGWALLGTAAVGGAGIVCYKLYKRWTREARHARRIKKYSGITNATDAALTLIDIYLGNLPERDRDAAGLILETFGVKLKELVSDRTHKAAIALVVRHLEK